MIPDTFLARTLVQGGGRRSNASRTRQHWRPRFCLCLLLLLGLWGTALGQNTGADCLEIVSDTLRCAGDELGYHFSFINRSAYTVNTVGILESDNGDGEDLLISEGLISLEEEVLPGATYKGSIPVSFIDGNSDGSFCFDVVLRRVLPGTAINLECCYLTHCLNADSGVYLAGGELLNAQLEATVNGSLGCSTSNVVLSGELTGLPPGAGGSIMWTGPSADALLPPPTGTRVTATQSGVYAATYRSEFGCTLTDSVVVSRASDSLVARPDTLRFGPETATDPLDLLANDSTFGPVSIRLLNTTSFGETELSPDGVLTFFPPACTVNETSLTYEITSLACPERSATATVLLLGEGPEIYNAITPDGDGLNETFVFEQLEYCPDRFGDNEMIIFNRWGDIVYEAKPYRNEWGGTNQRGGLLPEGTYYYVLRLNIGSGDILRGDVTVVY